MSSPAARFLQAISGTCGVLNGTLLALGVYRVHVSGLARTGMAGTLIACGIVLLAAASGGGR